MKKLETKVRAADKKKEANRLRREGRIPAIIYGHAGTGVKVSVSKAEFKAIMAQVAPGHLPTTIFHLVDENGKESRAIVKEIQYAPTTYEVTHLDFEELKDTAQINIKVPIELTGLMNCKGAREGGVPRQVIRHLKVRCFPKHIPSHLELDVTDLGIADVRRLSEMSIPSGITPRVDLNEVAVVIVKR